MIEPPSVPTEDYPFYWKLEDNIWVPYALDSRGRETRAAFAPLPGSQQAFLECPIFEACYGGGRGFGKSDCLIVDYAKDVDQGYGKDWKGLLLRKTMDELREIIDKSYEIFGNIFPKAYFNQTEKIWYFPGGETLKLRFLEHPRDYYHYHGHQYTWLGFEELTTWPTDECYKPMMSLVRSKNPNVPCRIRSNTNPYGVGHNWVNARFGFDQIPTPGIGEVHVEEMKNPITNEMMTIERVGIQGHLSENFVLLHAQPDYPIKVREAARSEAEERAWVDGDWTVAAGGIFDDIWMKVKHRAVIPPFEVPRSWIIDRSFDWGSAKPFSVGWWAESDGTDLRLSDGRTISTVPGDLFRIAEWYGWNGAPDEGLKMLATEIAQGIVDREIAMGLHGRVREGVADSSIFDENNGNCIADDMAQQVRLDDGKVYPGVTWQPADKGPGSIQQGCEQIRKMLKSHAVDGPRETPGLFVVNTCRQWLRTVPTLPRSETKPNEYDTKAEDHIADETRYRCRMERRISSFGRLKGMT